MCGIAGIVSKREFAKQILLEMLGKIPHRGPNGDGCFYEKEFSFGHSRLSILDLSDVGHQPMAYRGQFVITYNGEIYNYIELKYELERLGHLFKTSTDIEVILAAYSEWGVDCVNKFNGMWSFALFDKAKNFIFCSRDRFGIKPFYYTTIDGDFVFASEIKQLLPLLRKRIFNKKAIIDFSVCGLSDHSNETFFKDVLTLPGGHNLIYNLTSREFKIVRFYELKRDDSLCNLDELKSVEKFKTDFSRSVSWRLRADVSVGTCLSGRMDSSSDGGLASELYHKKCTISL